MSSAKVRHKASYQELKSIVSNESKPKPQLVLPIRTRSKSSPVRSAGTIIALRCCQISGRWEGYW
jgi:hypothetical protein